MFGSVGRVSRSCGCQELVITVSCIGLRIVGVLTLVRLRTGWYCLVLVVLHSQDGQVRQEPEDGRGDSTDEHHDRPAHREHLRGDQVPGSVA